MADIFLLKGVPGSTGDKGPIGDQGPQGDAGPQGAAGTNGTNGSAGATGPTGATGPNGAAGAAGTFVAISRHDTTSSPVALYQLDSSLVDGSGNGLTLTCATPLYSDVYAGVRGNLPNASTLAALHRADPLLIITGDITVACLVYANKQVSSATAVVTQVGDSTDGSFSNAWNYLFSLGMGIGSLNYIHEATGPSTRTYSVDFQVPIRQLFHYAFTRVSNVIQFYVNGRPAGAASSALTAPGGGTSSQLCIGGRLNGDFSSIVSDSLFNGVISSVKIISSGLTATQMKSLYNNSMGTRLPQAP